MGVVGITAQRSHQEIEKSWAIGDNKDDMIWFVGVDHAKNWMDVKIDGICNDEIGLSSISSSAAT